MNTFWTGFVAAALIHLIGWTAWYLAPLGDPEGQKVKENQLLVLS